MRSLPQGQLLSPSKVAAPVVAIAHSEMTAPPPSPKAMRRRKRQAPATPIGSGSTPPPTGADHELTLREAAAALKLPTRVVEEYARRGELLGKRTQYGWRFTPQALEAFWEPCPEWSIGPVPSEK
jgi:Helix-turn-helix domain